MSNYSDKYNSHLSKIERVVLVTTASYNHLRNTSLLAIPCCNIAAISLQNSLTILLQCCGYTGLHMQISIAVILAILQEFGQYCRNSGNIATIFFCKDRNCAYTISHICIDGIKLIFNIHILLLKLVSPNVITNKKEPIYKRC